MVVADLQEDQSLLIPPIKRGRYDQLDWTNNRYVMMNDRSSVIEATQQMILMERPDLIEVWQSLCKSWLAPPSRWPTAPLTSVQHRMANEGLISMDSETCRWNVNLTQLLVDLQSAPPNLRKPVAVHETANLTTSSSMVAPAAPPVEEPQEASALSALWLPKLSALVETCQPCNLRDSGWQGVLARVDKKKTPVKLLMYAGNILAYIQTLNNVLSISLRSPHDEMLKKEFVAFGFLQNAAPADPTAVNAFQLYQTYFEERNRAGVIRVNEAENLMLYVIPLSVPGVAEVLTKYHIDLGPHPTLLLIVARTAAAAALD